MKNKIIIYDGSTKKGQFINYGLGVIQRPITFIEDEKLNGGWRVELTIDIDNPKSKYLVKWNILMVNGQLFRIYIVDIIDETNELRIIANHIFYDIGYGFTIDNRAENKVIKQAMEIAVPTDFKNIFDCSVSQIVSDSKDFVTVYFVKNNGVESMMGLIERIGTKKVELVRDNFNIIFRNPKEAISGVTFTYKKIKGLTITDDGTDIVTRLYPTGKDGIALPDHYVVVPQWENGDYPPFHITKEIKFSEANSEGTLRMLAIEEAKSIGLERVSFKIDVQDLLETDLYELVPELVRLKVGDIVTIKHPKLDVRVRAKVIKKNTDHISGAVSIELGYPNKNFFDSVDNGNTGVPEIDMSGYKESLFYYVNPSEIIMENSFKQICNITYGVQAMANVNISINMFMEVSQASLLEIRMYVNEDMIDFAPDITVDSGKRLVSYNYPLIGIEPNQAHQFKLAVKTSGGIKINPNHLHIMLTGQGLSGGNSGEKPRVDVVEIKDFEQYILVDFLKHNDDVFFTHLKPQGVNMKELLKFDVLNSMDIKRPELVDLYLIHYGYSRPIDHLNYIFDNIVIDVTGNSMTVNSASKETDSRKSLSQLSGGVLHEIPLIDRKIWNSVEGSEWI